MALQSQCRFCHEKTPPLIAPCNCDGSIKYIHRSCILRWATMNGQLDYSRLICSLCTTPYTIPEIRLEKFSTGSYMVDFSLYNSAATSIIINYLSIIFGVYSGHSIPHQLMVGQLCIYLMYGFLYCRYVRIHNVELYTNIVIRRRAYLYGLIQLYSSYTALTDQYALMSITAMVSQTLIWKEHVRILQIVNEELIKND